MWGRSNSIMGTFWAWSPRKPVWSVNRSPSGLSRVVWQTSINYTFEELTSQFKRKAKGCVCISDHFKNLIMSCAKSFQLLLNMLPNQTAVVWKHVFILANSRHPDHLLKPNFVRMAGESALTSPGMLKCSCLDYTFVQWFSMTLKKV